MSEDRSPTSNPGQPVRRDSKTDLLEAARTAIHDQEEKSKSFRLERNQHTSRSWVAGFLVISLAGLALLVLQPPWLAGPAAPPVETPSVSAASMRLVMLRERQRVEDYLRKTGRLPATVAEAGSTLTGITLKATTDSGFELSAFAGDSLITLGSGDSMRAFLGDTFMRLRDRGRR